jgi:hypothetical protein
MQGVGKLKWSFVVYVRQREEEVDKHFNVLHVTDVCCYVRKFLEFKEFFCTSVKHNMVSRCKRVARYLKKS